MLSIRVEVVSLILVGCLIERKMSIFSSWGMLIFLSRSRFIITCYENNIMLFFINDLLNVYHFDVVPIKVRIWWTTNTAKK